MTSYNLACKSIIIGNADINYSAVDLSGAIEIYPYEDQIQQAGLAVTGQEAWTDFKEIADVAVFDAAAAIQAMLQTMIKSFKIFRSDITIEKRKDVFSLSVIKEGKNYELVMVHDLQPFVTEKRQHEPCILVHDPETFDFWRFDAASADEDIVSDLLISLRTSPN